MGKLTAVFSLFQKGGAMTNAAAWKSRAAVFSFLLAVLGLLVAFGVLKPGQVSADDLQLLAGGIVGVMGIVNGFIHVAGSADVGVGVLHGGGAAAAAGSDVGRSSAGPDDQGGA